MVPSSSAGATSPPCRRTTRDVNTVFQDYALFPHMTVAENVEYGLQGEARAKGERSKRVEEALEIVQLAGFGDAQAEPALGRPAAARRARPRDRQPATRAPARRAARRARPEASPGDADRAQADPAGGRDHLHLRHARPGRGADDERPHRGLQPGPDRADRERRSRSTSIPRRSSSPGSSASRTCSSATGAASPSDLRRSACSGPTRRPRQATKCNAGVVREVVYVGSVTRYIVDLDSGRRR